MELYWYITANINHFGKSILVGLEACLTRLTPISLSPCQNTLTWNPPQSGMLKLNVDVAIFQQHSSFGVRLCISDEKGTFLQAKTQWKHGIPVPKEVEAWAFLQSLLWIQQLECHNICIEVATNLWLMIYTADKITNVNSILNRCKDLLFNFSNPRVDFVRRQINKVLHSLASASLSSANIYDFYHIHLCSFEWKEVDWFL